MASDDDADDYLSDKFLFADAAPSAPAPRTYTQRRQDAQKRAADQQAAGRIKGQREREREARDAGLARSLFERAEAEPPASGTTKALDMMRKMGFRPGQALGRAPDAQPPPPPPPEPAQLDARLDEPDEEMPVRAGIGARAAKEEEEDAPPRAGIGARAAATVESKTANAPARQEKSHHIVEPLPLQEWTGKKGIGAGPPAKRALSPSAAVSLAKAAKHAEAESVGDFRARQRAEYLLRRAEGWLVQAQQTCRARDAGAGIAFNVLWLDAEMPDSVPGALLDRLGADAAMLAPRAVRQRAQDALLQAQMRRDALQPLPALGDEDDDGALLDEAPRPVLEDRFDPETVARARAFLASAATDRLDAVLDYLRHTYHYCFWCGVPYADAGELADACPGPDEESHD